MKNNEAEIQKCIEMQTIESESIPVPVSQGLLLLQTSLRPALPGNH